jgi:hypothetical protein
MISETEKSALCSKVGEMRGKKQTRNTLEETIINISVHYTWTQNYTSKGILLIVVLLKPTTASNILLCLTFLKFALLIIVLVGSSENPE